MINSSILIATLGSEAQVITLTLELLLAQGCNIRELVIVHTLPEQEPVRSALARLNEFFGETRHDSFLFRPVLIGAPEPIADLVTEDEVGALFRKLYREVLAAKRAGKTVHLSIAGGRKTMAVYGMAVAQMLFDDDDHLWHLLSTGKILEEKRMQLQPGDEVKLIPMIPAARAKAAVLGLLSCRRHHRARLMKTACAKRRSPRPPAMKSSCRKWKCRASSLIASPIRA